MKRKKMKISSVEMEKLKEVLENFKVLVNNLVPITSDQAEWICNEIERLSREYPGLKVKLKELCKVGSDGTEWINKPLIQILSEMEERERKRRRRVRSAGQRRLK